jgi:hypothetical protein
VIEYDGIFYWIGTDRFLCYNGVVQEVENKQNNNYFFDNLNYAQRQKVWVSKVPRWGEIWWFFPNGDNTECNDAIIYNVREKCWYDAGEALGARRSAGVWTRIERIEPDFVQNGTMEVIITGKSYADDTDDPSDPYSFNPDTLKIDMKEQRREMRLRFKSNTQNGDYFMGRVLLSIDTGDVRGSGNP